jgi:predicted nuclease of predicted toxin-antitoxin system
MLFKIDENLPTELAQLMVSSGYDAKTVYDQQLQGVDDPVLMDRCDQEKRILITLDIDFSDITLYPPEKHAGILVLRLANQSKQNILNVFRKILTALEREPIKNHLWIVDETVIRIRGKDE